jgi:hypothetical protein
MPISRSEFQAGPRASIPQLTAIGASELTQQKGVLRLAPGNERLLAAPHLFDWMF